MLKMCDNSEYIHTMEIIAVVTSYSCSYYTYLCFGYKLGLLYCSHVSGYDVTEKLSPRFVYVII